MKACFDKVPSYFDVGKVTLNGKREGGCYLVKMGADMLCYDYKFRLTMTDDSNVCG